MRVIYSLKDPLTSEVRYVGKADNLKKRVQNHYCPSNLSEKKHCSRWLAKLVRSGMKPEVIVLENLQDEDDWEEAERWWIAKYRGEGASLTNITDGGEGGATYGRLGKKNSEEHKRKISEARKGVPQSPETYAKLYSPEVKKRRSEATKAHWKKERAEGRKKKGQVHTAETKANLSAKHKGKVLTPEHKRKLCLAKFGQPPPIKRQIALLKKRRS